MLAKFKQFVDEINAENGRNYKISILEKYKDDEDIKYLLDFIYNPYITTGISTKSYSRFHNKLCSGIYPKNIFNSTREALEYLKVHNTSDDNTRELMFSYYMHIYLYEVKTLLETSQPAELHELFYYIITKNIQLGIDSKTINKVIPNLIPEFAVQLANKYFDNPDKLIGKEFALTTKIDGMRCVMLKKDNNITFWSRKGQKIEGLVDLEQEAKAFPDNLCLDGELVAIVDGPDTYKDTMRRARQSTNLEKHGLKMLVFDCMTAEQFENQVCEDTYRDRRAYLSSIFNENCHLYFQCLPMLYVGTDTNKIIEFLNEETNKGEEGIMINIVDAPYVFGRTWDLMKVKKFKDTEVKVINFEEGTNSNTGTLGALVCEYKGNELRVGSGFSEEQRDYIWNHKEEYLNKLITVKYFEETYNSTTKLPSLRFPTFLRLKED